MQNKRKWVREPSPNSLLKDDTNTITISDIKTIFDETIKSAGDIVIAFSAENYKAALMAEAEDILADANEVDIVNKLVLSMAVRIKAEEYMKNILSTEEMSEMKENINQTGELVKVFKKYHAIDKPNQLKVVNKVLLLTSENIHLNNFMFEPLVDISILYLKKLYNDCKTKLL